MCAPSLSRNCQVCRLKRVMSGGGGGSEWLSAPGSTITVLVLVNQLLYIRYYTLEYR